MLEKDFTIINKLGLHARAAAKLVAHASRYSAQIDILKGEQHINAKSIMGVMMLAASKGTVLTFVADGDDATEALADLEALIENRFGEAE